ncbi:MAG: AsmA-like C-terminal region-containing protein [Hyphomicrobiaceae bacterium]
MTPNFSARRWALLTLFVCGWLAIGVTLSVVQRATHTEQGVTDIAVVAATRYVAPIWQPITVVPHMGLSLDRGRLILSVPDKAGARPIDREKVLEQGGGELVLVDGVMTLFGHHEATSDADDLARTPPLIAAAMAHKFAALRLQSGTLNIALPGGGELVIHNAAAELKKRASRDLVLTARGTWMNEPVTLSVSLGPKAASVPPPAAPATGGAQVSGVALMPRVAGTGTDQRPTPATAPEPHLGNIQLALDSRHMVLRFNGAIQHDRGASFAGTLSLKVPRLATLVEAFGVDATFARAIGAFALTGSVDWSGPRLDISDVKLETNGHSSHGVLSLSRDAERPIISGTLDFGMLDLSKFIVAQTEPTSHSVIASTATWWTTLWSAFQGPVTRVVDLDLRLSADQMAFSGLELGRSAASLSIIAGAVRANVAEFMFAGGIGNGQVTTMTNDEGAATNVRGKIDRADLTAFAATFGLGPEAFPISGTGSIKFDLSTAGGDRDRFLRTLSGMFSIESNAQVRTRIDIEKLLAMDRAGPIEDIGGETRFDRFDAELAFFNGRLYCRAARFKRPDGGVSVTGTVDMISHAVEMEISDDRAAGTGLEAVAAAPQGRDANAPRRVVVTSAPIVDSAGDPSMRRTEAAGSFGRLIVVPGRLTERGE